MAKPLQHDPFAEYRTESNCGATSFLESKGLYVIPSKLEVKDTMIHEIQLPKDISMEILERLPIKSFVRFKAVCKSWKSLISSPYFTDCHFDRSAANSNKLGIVLEEYSDSNKCSIFFHTLDFSATSLGETTIVEHPITECEQANLLSWCRDLLLLRVKCFHKLLLWNPSTREGKEVPNTLHSYDYDYQSIYASALGYDFTLKTHKIVVILQTGRRWRFFSVYNVKTDKWEKNLFVDKNHHEAARFKDKPITLANGAPHWLICYPVLCDTCYYKIEYFDFALNKFEEIPQPDDGDYCISGKTANLFDKGGCLCIGYHTRLAFKVWVMREYGMKESWSKEMIFDTSIHGHHYPICFAKTINVSLVEEYVAEEKRCRFAIYDYDDKERGIELEFLTGRELTNKGAFAFVESLASLETEKVKEVAQEEPLILLETEKVEEEEPEISFGKGMAS
ncbi:hypothetical protein COLO4_29077 [Corchorus olitorius]|uniref:F-box domain-containing protein n=1 Tax=Corchorus olitorius TaxID=93759 RepID=A0A1R3HGA9_9ROSI|nr:hypothetical protein COLO4_29077 [Corchorus olitorius]